MIYFSFVSVRQVNDGIRMKVRRRTERIVRLNRIFLMNRLTGLRN